MVYVFLKTQMFAYSWYGFLLGHSPPRFWALLCGAECHRLLLKSAGVENVQPFAGTLSTLQDQALRARFCSWMRAHKSQAGGVVYTYLGGNVALKLESKQSGKPLSFLTSDSLLLSECALQDLSNFLSFFLSCRSPVPTATSFLPTQRLQLGRAGLRLSQLSLWCLPAKYSSGVSRGVWGEKEIAWSGFSFTGADDSPTVWASNPRWYNWK